MKSPLHHYYQPAFLRYFFLLHRTDDVAPVFLRLTSIPARGGNISRHQTTPLLISQESLSMHGSFMTSDIPRRCRRQSTLAGKLGRRSSSSSRSVHRRSAFVVASLSSISIITNILLRGGRVSHTQTHTTSHCSYRSHFDGRPARIPACGFHYTIRNNINIQFSSREVLHIFTLWGETTLGYVRGATKGWFT